MKRKLFSAFGFTLIELLVVIGILAIMLSIVLIAVNPLEQFKQTRDITTQSMATDFIKATNIYYVDKARFPWNDNINCMDELNNNSKLIDMPTCINQLVNGGVLEQTYKESSEVQTMRMIKCEDSAVSCYKQESKQFISQATYNQFGVIDPSCPGSGECYSCKPLLNNPQCTAPMSSFMASPSATMTPTPLPTSTPTPTPTIAPTSTPHGQVWVTNGGSPSISRFNADGTSAGNPITGNGLDGPSGIAVVGNEIWVLNLGLGFANSISRFNFDGTSAGSPITGNSLGRPRGIAVVGSQVWVTNTNPVSVSRFNFDGTSAGSKLTGFSRPTAVVVVGSEVWIVNSGTASIRRYYFDGTPTGNNYMGGTLGGINDIAIIGTQVWLPTTNPNPDGILRFNFDGSSAGSKITGNGMNDPTGIAAVGSRVWVANGLDNSISVFNTNGTSAGNTITGNGMIYPWDFLVVP